MNHLAANLKAYAALVGAIATALLGVYGPDNTIGHALTALVAVCTSITVWRVPNRG